MAPSQLSPEEVAEAPELLVLATLDTNLWILQIALIAAFPELIDELARSRDGPSLRAARHLSERAALLQRAIERYQRVIRAERAPPRNHDDLPF